MQEKIPMSVETMSQQTKRANLLLRSEKRRKKNSGGKGLMISTLEVKVHFDWLVIKHVSVSELLTIHDKLLQALVNNSE